MITYTAGDILDDDAEAIVNTINCVGVMGKGLALAAKKRWPQMYVDYEAACYREEVRPGEMWVWATGELFGTRHVIGFPTKRHWRAPSQMGDIDAGLGALRRVIEDEGITSVAIPQLGCGHGGLQWADVGPRIVEYFDTLDGVDIRVYGPAHE